MRVLLDTHAFLWFISGDAKLSPQARETIEAATTQRYLSIASLWEIVIKTSIGKLPVSWSFTELIEDHVFGNDFLICRSRLCISPFWSRCRITIAIRLTA